MEQISQEKHQITIDEKNKYTQTTLEFMKTVKDAHYDHVTEFHISGYNSSVLTQALNGEIDPDAVNVYYENNKPQKIHLLYRNQDKGQDIDLYVSGRALNDFLSKKKNY